MTDAKYEDKGGLFRNTYKKPGEKTPDWRTKINISYDLLKALVADYKGGVDPVLEIAVWDGDVDPNRGFIKVQRPREKTDDGGLADPF